MLNRLTKQEYTAPEVSINEIDVLNVLCQSGGGFTNEGFTEDPEFGW